MSLEGDARQLIQNLPVSGDNFQIAWDLVSQRYNNPRVTATKHAKVLLNVPKVKTDSTNKHRILVNEMRSNIKALETVNTNIPVHEN